MNIKTSPSGRVVKMSTGYRAFVPHPLPPIFEWGSILVNSLSRADHVLGQLSSESNRLPNPYLFTRVFAAREAVLSSKIEGTQSTITEILEDYAGLGVDRDPDDLQEVKNYVTALNYGIDRLDALPLSLRLLREIHQKLMQGVRGDHATPGEFRLTQNWIGSAGCTLNTAKFVPPPPEELVSSLGNLEKFLHDRTLPPLVHIAMCHYQFEAIHPFIDGNERLGRLLITLLMLERKLLHTPLLYLSAFFESTKDEYYKQLFDVSDKGSWQEWFVYFLNGVATQATDVLDRVKRINDVLSQWRSLHKSLVFYDIYDLLMENPFLMITTAATKLGISFKVAQRALIALEKSGIVTEITNKARGRVYCARQLLSIIEEPTRIDGFE